jgi:hypothetical protein
MWFALTLEQINRASTGLSATLALRRRLGPHFHHLLLGTFQLSESNMMKETMMTMMRMMSNHSS